MLQKQKTIYSSLFDSLPLPDHAMKASAIRIDVNEIVQLERAVPQVAIATASIMFQLTGNLSFLQDDNISKEKRAKRLSILLLKALREIELQ